MQFYQPSSSAWHGVPAIRGEDALLHGSYVISHAVSFPNIGLGVEDGIGGAGILVTRLATNRG